MSKRCEALESPGGELEQAVDANLQENLIDYGLQLGFK